MIDRWCLKLPAFFISSRVELSKRWFASSSMFSSRSTKLSFRSTIRLKDVSAHSAIRFQLRFCIMPHRKSLQGDTRVGDAVISSVHSRAAGHRRRITGGILQGENLSDNYSSNKKQWVAALNYANYDARKLLRNIEFRWKDIKQPQYFIWIW